MSSTTPFWNQGEVATLAAKRWAWDSLDLRPVWERSETTRLCRSRIACFLASKQGPKAFLTLFFSLYSAGCHPIVSQDDLLNGDDLNHLKCKWPL